MIYQDLVERLKTDKKYEEAAHILMNYFRDMKEAIISLCNGKRWKDAVRIAHDTKNLDLIGRFILSKIIHKLNINLLSY